MFMWHCSDSESTFKGEGGVESNLNLIKLPIYLLEANLCRLSRILTLHHRLARRVDSFIPSLRIFAMPFLTATGIDRCGYAEASISNFLLSIYVFTKDLLSRECVSVSATFTEPHEGCKSDSNWQWSLWLCGCLNLIDCDREVERRVITLLEC